MDTVRIIVRTAVLGARLTHCIVSRLIGCLTNVAHDPDTLAPAILGGHVLYVDCSPAGQTGIAPVVGRRETGTTGTNSVTRRFSR